MSNLFPNEPSEMGVGFMKAEREREAAQSAPTGVVIESSAEQIAKAQGRKPAVEKAASTPTRRELEAALEALAPTPEPEPTKYEVERSLRQGNLSSLVVEFGNNLKSLGILDSKDLATAKKAIDSLGVVSKSAAKAIDLIADAKLGLDPEPEKATRAPRAYKVGPLTGTATVAAPSATIPKTLPGKGPDEVGAELREKQAVEKSPAEIDAEIKVKRAGNVEPDEEEDF